MGWNSFIISVRDADSLCNLRADARLPEGAGHLSQTATSEHPTLIEVSNIAVQLGSFTLENISFEVAPGDYGVLMGRTGSGKTTILEVVCGLKHLSAGQIRLNGRDVTYKKPAERDIGYVPQDGALFPTMTVRDHLAFAPTLRGWTNRDIDARVEELADLLGIDYLLERKPHGLSGGETQRVALGRAIACRPGILCLDEPLSALDEETREEMYDLLKSVQRRTGVTALHVTHSRGEATALADRLLLLENGRIHMSNNNGSTKSKVEDAAINEEPAIAMPTEQAE